MIDRSVDRTSMTVYAFISISPVIQSSVHCTHLHFPCHFLGSLYSNVRIPQARRYFKNKFEFYLPRLTFLLAQKWPQFPVEHFDDDSPWQAKVILFHSNSWSQMSADWGVWIDNFTKSVRTTKMIVLAFLVYQVGAVSAGKMWYFVLLIMKYSL